MKWWQFHPIIAPYPRDWIHEENMRKDAKAWMNMATDHIEQLEAALLSYYRYVCPTCGGRCCVVQSCPENLARAALGEKKDD